MIQGAGPLGIAHLIMARMMGAGTGIVIDKIPCRLEAARSFGADHVANIEDHSDAQLLELVQQWTDGRGTDVAIECTGEPEAVPQALPWIRRGGMYLLEGVFVDMGEISFNPHLIVSKSLRLIGLSNHPFTAYQPSMDMMLRYQDQLPLDRFVTHRFPLDKAQEAIDTALAGECLKVVFAP